MEKENIDFEDYKAIWLSTHAIEETSNTTEKGRRFAQKLFTQYLDISEDDEDLFVSNGGGDGGIDIAYLQRSNSELDADGGDVWYVVQSKYGSAFKGASMLHGEAHKIFTTLTSTTHLSVDVKNVVEKIHLFMQNIGEQDRLILIFLTLDPITQDNDKRTLKEIEEYGKIRLGNYFEAKSVSLESVYAENIAKDIYIKVPLKAKLSNLADDTVLAGAVRLTDLYDFVKQYKTRSGGDLERLYDKNIRKFLGFKGKINTRMKNTLENEPHQFGLYNNGITIIVKDWRNLPDKDGYSLAEPSIVNGCQSVSTIWRVLDKQASSGGTGANRNDWRTRYEKAIAMVKIVKTSDESLVENITRYTNSQNAISDRDFLALENYFTQLKAEIEGKYQIFLEVQRGSWELQLARQKDKPLLKPFFSKDAHTNAFDLIKVYGAGWCNKVMEASVGYHSFNPGEPAFRDIVQSDEHPFGVDELFVAYQLSKQIDREEYSTFYREYKRRKTETKYIFYRVVVELLIPLLQDIKLDSDSRALITQSLKRLIIDGTTFEILISNAFAVMNTYLNPNERDSYRYEESMINLNDFSKYIRDQRLLKDRSYSKNLFYCIDFQRRFMTKTDESNKIKFVLSQTDFTKELSTLLVANKKPSEYALTVDELKHLIKPNLTWMEIFKSLDPERVIRGNARAYLKGWVKKNRSHWPPVPDR